MYGRPVLSVTGIVRSAGALGSGQHVRSAGALGNEHRTVGPSAR